MQLSFFYTPHSFINLVADDSFNDWFLLLAILLPSPLLTSLHWDSKVQLFGDELHLPDLWSVPSQASKWYHAPMSHGEAHGEAQPNPEDILLTWLVR